MGNAIARCYIRIILLSSENRILQLQTSVGRFYQYHEAYSSTSITLANRHESLRKDEGQRLRSTGACRDDNARHSRIRSLRPSLRRRRRRRRRRRSFGKLATNVCYFAGRTAHYGSAYARHTLCTRSL